MSDRKPDQGSASKNKGPHHPEYIVHKGRQPGSYQSWPETEEQVHKYPGNCYQKVKPPDNSHYVVYEGKNPGVYKPWQVTHEQVSGYPNNRYEKVKSEEEAKKRFEDYQYQSYGYAYSSGGNSDADGYSSSD